MRHQFTPEERRRGGLTRAAQPSMQEARSKGFWVTYDRHPWFARHWLRVRIKAQNGQRARKAAVASLITRTSYQGKRRPMRGN